MRLIYLSIWCYPKRGRKSLNPWAAFPLAATYSHRPSDLTRRRSIYFRCTLAAMRWTRKISAKVLGCAEDFHHEGQEGHEGKRRNIQMSLSELRALRAFVVHNPDDQQY